MERERCVAEEEGFAKVHHMNNREIDKSVVTKTRIDGGMMLSEKRVPKKERMHRFSLQGHERKPQGETEAARRNAWLKVKQCPTSRRKLIGRFRRCCRSQRSTLRQCDFSFSAEQEWLRWLAPCGASFLRVCLIKLICFLTLN